jgi:hypothetical protein
MVATLTDKQIRYAGRKILLYRPLPAADAFHRSQAKNRWFFGGNRSGKSEANIGFDLCSFALGVHPHRRTPRNAVIWVATNTWPDIGKVIYQEKVKLYLPTSQVAAITWHRKDHQEPEEIRLRNGNVIEFKAYEQGRTAFQGRAIDAFYGDEQCAHDSEAIWQEVQARLMDRGGFSAQSMTPILHQKWLEERIRALPETDVVFYANLEDNRRSRGGYVADEEIDALMAQWAEEIRETRVKGYFAAFMGAVFTTFSRDVHVCKPFPIPDDWPRWRSIDFGFNNPFACLWLALDPDNRWYVYHEHYKGKASLAFHAERIKGISGREKYRATWADHDAQDRFELEQHEIKTVAARKDIRLGIEVVQTVLKVQGDGRPRLYIFSTCKHTIEEMTGYKWAEGTEAKDAKDEPLKVNDHTVDALRYAIFGVEGPSYFIDCDLS